MNETGVEGNGMIFGKSKLLIRSHAINMMWTNKGPSGSLSTLDLMTLMAMVVAFDKTILSCCHINIIFGFRPEELRHLVSTSCSV